MSDYVSKPSFHFAVTAAEWALPNAPVLLRCDTRHQFEQAKKLGYDAIELHLRTPEDVPASDLTALQKEFGVRVSAVATGLSKLIDQLCFIDPQAAIRTAAVKRILSFVDWAAEVGCAIILGSMRGNLPEGEQRTQAERWMRESLNEIVQYAKSKSVTILLEVINRYENNYLNTAAETVAYVESFDSPFLKVHLDTFHMNIEEADMIEAIRTTGAQHLGYIHFADNNRHACGEGALDFSTILNALNDIGYTGYASVECLCIPDGYSAANNSLGHLNSLIEQN